MAARIPNWLTRLLPGRIARQVALLASATVFGRILAFLASPVLSRLFSQEDFGVLAVYSSTLPFLIALGALRYEWAIPVAERRQEVKDLLALCFFLIAAVAATIGLVGWIFGGSYADLVNTPAILDWMWLFPLGAAGAALYKTLNMLAVRHKEYPVIARTTVTRSVGQVGVQLGLGALSFAPGGLLLGHFTSKAAGILPLVGSARRAFPRGDRNTSITGMRNVARRFVKFPALSLPGSLLTLAGLELPALFLAAMFSTETAGLFFFANRIVRTPVVLITEGIGKVFLGEASEIVRERPERLSRFLRKMTGRLIFIGLIPTAILVLTGPWLFGFIFGDSWTEAGVFAQLLALPILGRLVVSPISSISRIVERQGGQLWLDVFRVTMVVGGFILANSLGMDARATILVYAISLFTVYVVSLLWYFRIARLPHDLEVTEDRI